METILNKIGDEEEANREIYEAFIEIVQASAGAGGAGAGGAGGAGAGQGMAWLPTLQRLDYDHVETMAYQLTLQLQFLEEQGMTLLFWRPQDILVVDFVVDGKMFLLANLSQLVPLSEKEPDNLVLKYPAIYPFPAECCAPELLTLTELPFITHKNVSYYSLALLCLQVVNLYAPNLSLEELQGTKLFYFIERCLKERVLLYL